MLDSRKRNSDFGDELWHICTFPPAMKGGKIVLRELTRDKLSTSCHLP
jgi:hypothetical protein